LDKILWLHGEFKIKILKYVKRDQKIKNWGPTCLGLNLAKMGLNFEAQVNPFHPGAPNGDVNMQTSGDYEVLKHSFPMLVS
jgi:hypothetical protein